MTSHRTLFRRRWPPSKVSMTKTKKNFASIRVRKISSERLTDNCSARETLERAQGPFLREIPSSRLLLPERSLRSKRRQKCESAGKFYLSAPAKVVLCRQLGTILPAKRRRCRQIFTLKRAGKKVVAPANTLNVPANSGYGDRVMPKAEDAIEWW